MDEMEESTYCTTLHAITREICKQTYVGRDPYVMKRSDFSTELKDFPAIEALEISNYELPRLADITYFDFTNFGNITHYTNTAT